MDWPDTSLTLIQFIPLDVEPLGPMSPLHTTATIAPSTYHSITLIAQYKSCDLSLVEIGL